MIKNRLLNMIRKLDLDNPLEFVRTLVAPLCKEKMNKYILECKDCKSCNSVKKLAEGNPNANYLIINDNATDNEEINSYFNSLIEAAGIPLDDVFTINSVSCVLKKKFENDEEIIRLPNRQEANNCKHFVNYAIDFVNPRVIICMGSTSLAMYKNDVTIEDIKGQFIDIKGKKALVTNSAKDLFTLANHYEESEMDVIVAEVVNDLCKAKEYIDSLGGM